MVVVGSRCQVRNSVSNSAPALGAGAGPCPKSGAPAASADRPPRAVPRNSRRSRGGMGAVGGGAVVHPRAYSIWMNPEGKRRGAVSLHDRLGIVLGREVAG